MTTTETLNGRIIGQAALATRALLEQRLVHHGIDFGTSVMINLLATAGGSRPATALAEQLSTGLRIPAEAAAAAIEAAVAAGLSTTAPDGTIALTEHGTATAAAVQTEIDALTGRLYGDLPEADLVTAGRVLTLVTQRAAAELAS